MRLTAEREERQLRGRIEEIDIAASDRQKGECKSKAVKIQSNSKGSERQGRKLLKPVFPPPSLEMVHQAFQMLDPTGAGVLNPIALREASLMST